jgi:hypothetical protein
MVASFRRPAGPKAAAKSIKSIKTLSRETTAHDTEASIAPESAAQRPVSLRPLLALRPYITRHPGTLAA